MGFATTGFSLSGSASCSEHGEPDRWAKLDRLLDVFRIASLFDALGAARARDIDIVIADTAGRLHTAAGLMDELDKIKRVISRFDASAPHETLLVLDASQGQNALVQARQFHAKVGLTGLALTKLDGSAKGGIALAIAKAMPMPIRFIGVGEGVDDFNVFDADEFAAALIGADEPDTQS